MAEFCFVEQSRLSTDICDDALDVSTNGRFVVGIPWPFVRYRFLPQERRDVILMNPRDIERLGLKVDQRVSVKSDIGEMKEILIRSFDIRPGNVLMYYPEANVLVPRVVDPQSKTPAFKGVPVVISPMIGAVSVEGRQALELISP